MTTKKVTEKFVYVYVEMEVGDELSRQYVMDTLDFGIEAIPIDSIDKLAENLLDLKIDRDSSEDTLEETIQIRYKLPHRMGNLELGRTGGERFIHLYDKLNQTERNDLRYNLIRLAIKDDRFNLEHLRGTLDNLEREPLQIEDVPLPPVSEHHFSYA